MQKFRVWTDEKGAWMDIQGRKVPISVGRSGIITKKKEGDGATPTGEFNLLGVWYRPDRLKCPQTALPVHKIHSDDIWIDDADSPSYNMPGKLEQFPKTEEKLWREDHLYDIVVDVNYNHQPALPGKGSAIFIHLARNQENPQLSATEGCIGLKKSDLLELLTLLDSNSVIKVSS